MICFLKFGERASHEDVWMILISRSSIIHLFKPSKSCPFQTIVCKSAAQQKNNSINSWWIKTSNLNCRMQMSSQLFTWTVKNNKSWNTGWYRATNHCFEYLTNLEQLVAYYMMYINFRYSKELTARYKQKKPKLCRDNVDLKPLKRQLDLKLVVPVHVKNLSCFFNWFKIIMFMHML